MRLHELLTSRLPDTTCIGIAGASWAIELGRGRVMAGLQAPTADFKEGPKSSFDDGERDNPHWYVWQTPSPDHPDHTIFPWSVCPQLVWKQTEFMCPHIACRTIFEAAKRLTAKVLREATLN